MLLFLSLPLASVLPTEPLILLSVFVKVTSAFLTGLPSLSKTVKSKIAAKLMLLGVEITRYGQTGSGPYLKRSIVQNSGPLSLPTWYTQCPSPL